jgi:hypothetical protein
MVFMPRQQGSIPQKIIQGSDVFAILGYYHQEKRWSELPGRGMLLRSILDSEIRGMPAEKRPAWDKQAGLKTKAEEALKGSSEAFYQEAKEKIIGCIYRAFEKETTIYIESKGLKYNYTLEKIDLPIQTLRDNAVWALLRNYSEMCRAIEHGIEIDLYPNKENAMYQVYIGRFDQYMSRILGDWVRNVWNAEGEKSAWLTFDDMCVEHFPNQRKIDAEAIFNLRSEMGIFLAGMAGRIEKLVRETFWKE